MKRYLLPAACLGAAAFLGGCETLHHRGAVISTTAYSRIIASDFEGHRSSEYIAEGTVRDCGEDGYSFKAVERRIFEPKALVFRYPLGRPISAKASNLVIEPAPKPLWLERIDCFPSDRVNP